MPRIKNWEKLEDGEKSVNYKSKSENNIRNKYRRLKTHFWKNTETGDKVKVEPSGSRYGGIQWGITARFADTRKKFGYKEDAMAKAREIMRENTEED